MNDVLQCEFSDFDRRVKFRCVLKSKSVDFTGVFRDFEIGFLMVCDVKFPYYKRDFRWSSIESLFFKTFRGFWKVILMILLMLKVVRMLIF